MDVQASTFKPLDYSDGSFIFRDLEKFRYLRSDWKIVTPRRKTRLEQGDQYADATVKRINAQEALLIAKQNGLNRQHKVEQTVNMYAMLCVGANAVAQ
ncbi:MAG: hypothetical protein EZS28_046135, partial [Streblomastix strix]